MITHREFLDARREEPPVEVLRAAAELAAATVQTALAGQPVYLRWEAIVRMVGGARTAKEWRPGWPLPADTREVVAVAFGWSTRSVA